MKVDLGNGFFLFDRRPTAWVDTNIVLEIESAHDIIQARRNGTPADVEYRRMRMQDSLYMAIVLAGQRALTVTYNHEIENNLRHFFKDERQKWWSWILTQLWWNEGNERGGVFEDWASHTTSAMNIGPDGKRPNKNARDRFMRETCLQWRIPYITHDGPSYDRAKTMDGLDVVRSAEYAERFAPRVAARDLFFARLDGALMRFIAKGTSPEHRERRRRFDTEVIRRFFVHIWP